MQDYGTFHEKPSFTEINYYRLALTDLDGSKRTYDTHVLSVDNRAGSKKVEKIFNLMGQEIDDSCKGVMIYYYSDGTTERVYR